ncbi:MAG: PQQ-binding-like beta-propeller repeat protein, partial [Anaeromyxobacteraceae bacterium]
AFDLARPGRQATLRVVVDVRGVSVSGAHPVRCDPLAFAQAVAAGAADLCAVIRARAPAQAGNVLLDDLSRSASALLDHVAEAREGDRPSPVPRRVRRSRPRRPVPLPLGPGHLRRISFRTLVTADVGAPAGEGLFRIGERVIACGAARTRAFDARTGAALWEGAGGRAACLIGSGLAVLRGDALALVDAESGVASWIRPDLVDARHPRLLPASPGGALLAVSGPSVLAVDSASGAPLWTFTAPGAVRVAPLPLPPLVVLASDTGMVHALDPAGRVAWRLRGSGPIEAAPWGDAHGCLLPFRSPTGSTLTCADPATGARLFEASLDFTPTTSPIRFAGRIAVAGRIAGDGVVAALEEDGGPAWTEPSPVPGPPVLAVRPRGLLAKTPDGSCAALDRDGRTLWVRSAGGRPVPPGNVPPIALRGVVVVAAEEVELLDGATGAPVGRIPVHAPGRIAVDDDLGAWAIDPDGLVTGARVRGHLSVLGAPGEPGAAGR